MHRSAWVLFFSSAAFSGIFGLSRESAAWRGLDAAACRPQAASGYAQFDNNGSLITTNNSLALVCPVVDGSDLSKANTGLHVDIDQNNPNTASGIAACQNFEGALGGSCGSVVSTSGTGIKNLFVSSGWPSSDYGYALVFLATKFNGTTSKIKGYWWQ